MLAVNIAEEMLRALRQIENCAEFDNLAFNGAPGWVASAQL